MRGRPTANIAIVADAARAVADATRTRLSYVIIGTSTAASTVVATSIGATVDSAVSNSTTGGSVRLRQLLVLTRPRLLALTAMLACIPRSANSLARATRAAAVRAHRFATVEKDNTPHRCGVATNQDTGTMTGISVTDWTAGHTLDCGRNSSTRPQDSGRLDGAAVTAARVARTPVLPQAFQAAIQCS